MMKLPQPVELKDFPPNSYIRQAPYRYIRQEEVEALFFPSPSLSKGQLCWVLLSKGKGRSSPQLYQRARVLSSEEDSQDPDDKEGRLLVQYPKGSTYRVRRAHLLPVLEPRKEDTNDDDGDDDHHYQQQKQPRLVMVASETNDYRRTAIVQTCEQDHFLEIGCDFGILVDSVRCQSAVGVDKSEESIRIAKERYPSRKFILADVFEEELPVQLNTPLVVAIDINGNRALPAVLNCIQLAMDKWNPRLIVVKSRELYAAMKEREESLPHAME